MRRPGIFRKSASERFIQITLDKDLSCKFNSNTEFSPFLSPNNYKSELALNINLQSTERLANVVKSPDSHLIPTPKTPKNPHEVLRKSILKLKSTHSDEVVLALKDIIQISRFHPDLLTNCMPTIYKGIIGMLKSLRITTARTACQVANELFMNMPCDQGTGFDDLVQALLQKTSDTNKILREDALEALDSMVIHVPPARSIKALLNRRISNYNLNIRITASRLLTCVIGESDAKSVASINEDMKTKVVFAAVRFLQDPNYDIKFCGMRIFTILYENKDFQDVFQTKITDELFKKMKKIIESVKNPKRYINM